MTAWNPPETTQALLWCESCGPTQHYYTQTSTTNTVILAGLHLVDNNGPPTLVRWFRCTPCGLSRIWGIECAMEEDYPSGGKRRASTYSTVSH